MTFAALLRGVNVGGKGLLNMKTVKATLEGLGYRNVATYINSGNVVFQADRRTPRGLEQELEGVLPCRIVVKSFKEYKSLIDAVPLGWGEVKAIRYYVMFLRHTVDAKALLASLKPKDALEKLLLVPGAVLWSVAFADASRSGVAKVAAQPVYQEMTVRNWNTARKLFEMMQALERTV